MPPPRRLQLAYVVPSSSIYPFAQTKLCTTSILDTGRHNADWRLSRTMKLYSYVVMHDTGFAPNPFYG